MNNYKVRVTDKAFPFTEKDMLLGGGMPLTDAMKFAKTLNVSFAVDNKKTALVEYDNLQGETDDVIKQKIADEISKYGLENDDSLAVFKDNMLILRAEDLTKISAKNIAPTEFLLAKDLGFGMDAYEATKKAKDILEEASIPVAKLVTIEAPETVGVTKYDIVNSDGKVIAENLAHVESAETITKALSEGEPINASIIIDALQADRKYTAQINAKFEELSVLLKQNKPKTSTEIFEEQSIQMLHDVEALASKLDTLVRPVY